jgi:hypothetical protein
MSLGTLCDMRQLLHFWASLATLDLLVPCCHGLGRGRCTVLLKCFSATNLTITVVGSRCIKHQRPPSMAPILEDCRASTGALKVAASHASVNR